jgi:hypothetical protein
VREELFSNEYQPGTFLISERKTIPDFLSARERVPFSQWVYGIVSEHLKQLRNAPDLPGDIRSRTKQVDESRLQQSVLDAFEDTLPGGQRLCEMVWNQEYDDVFRRLESGFIFGDPDSQFDVYSRLNKAGKRLALWILRQLANDPLQIPDLITLCILSGLIGLNHKTSAAAASPINPDRIIPISLDSNPEEYPPILAQLKDRMRQTPAIDNRLQFLDMVLDSSSPRTLAFLLDDYIESLFDLKLAETLLEHNPCLSVQVISRSCICGNDFSYNDCLNLLNLPEYAYLAHTYRSQTPRLLIIPDGPRIGGLNGNKISRSVGKALLKSDFLYVKGARNYEMMQGIRREAFYGFSVCREVSELLTGIPSCSGSPVFIHQPAGCKSFIQRTYRASGKSKYL